MSLPVLALKLITIANITLERQVYFESLSQRTHTEQNYDFVVVGGGTAGSVVASRLSENPNHHVLLIEAGDEESIVSDMPGLFHMTFSEPGMDEWHYMTEPQTSSLNRRFRIHRGKHLGGCSTVNSLAYIRGNKHIYDEWDQEYGAKGWSYAELISTFKKFERQTDPEILSKHKEYYGTEGPVYIRSPKQAKIESEWFEHLEKSGYHIVDDLNTPDYGDKNVGMIQQTIQNGRRLSTASAYLRPHLNRSNLHIITKSTVTKILFEDMNHRKRATGVEFNRDGKVFKVNANREVIVSAGAIASPQLLMLSGIGIKSHLESLGIDVIEDLPVGNNLHDGFHAYFTVRSEGTNGYDLAKGVKNLLTTDNMYEFYKSGTGPLSDVHLHMASFNTKYNNRTEYPDAIIHSVVNLMSDGHNLIENMNVFIQLLKPQSRGTIRLKSRNPFDHPKIDPKYNSHPQDIKSMVEAFKELNRVAVSSPQFKELFNLNSKCETCTVSQTNDCQLYFECLAKEISAPTLHIAGSCRMGSASDPNAVVDERLRVRGIEHLRVIDASVMPQNTEPGTYAPTIMIGEKGSQIILQDNKA